jgi:pilus assembly protein Flp/PilA
MANRHRLRFEARNGVAREQGGPTVGKLVVRFLKDETAATAIEYGLIAAGISLLIIASVNRLGTKLNTTFANINSQLR